MISALFIDDDKNDLFIVQNYLEKRGGIKVATATTAKDALKILRHYHFDAVICDYLMPEMDGLEFLKTIRSYDRTTPIIIYTGKGRQEVVIEALNHGADYYLEKEGIAEFRLAQLRYMLEVAVARRRASETDAIERSEAQALLLKMPVMLYTSKMRRKGIFEFVSEGCGPLTGYNSTDLSGELGIPYPWLIHDDDRPFVQQLIDKSLNEKIPFSVRYRIRTFIGEERWVYEHGFGLYSGNSELSEVVGIITESENNHMLPIENPEKTDNGIENKLMELSSHISLLKCLLNVFQIGVF